MLSTARHWHDLRINGLRIIGFHFVIREMDGMPFHEWTPEKQLERLDRDFENVIDHFMRHDWGEPQSKVGARRTPALESFIDSGQLVIRMDLPGVDPKDVEVKVAGTILTIRGSRAIASAEQHRHFMHREIGYGSFERAISIPKGVKQEDITAAWRNGVIELIVPLPEGVEIKRVPLLISR